MKYVVSTLLALGLVAGTRAEAVPLEYHFTLGLGSVTEASVTFDVWATLDDTPIFLGNNHVAGEHTTFYGFLGSNVRLGISGAGLDGVYADNRAPQVVVKDGSPDEVTLFEFGFQVGSDLLRFGPITATFNDPLASLFQGSPLGAERVAPFAFGAEDVASWSIAWADLPFASEGYTLSVLNGSATPVGVPEPGTLLILSLGIAAVGAGRFYRRYQS